MFHDQLASKELLGQIGDILKATNGNFNLPPHLQEAAKAIARDYLDCQTLEQRKSFIEEAFVSLTSDDNMDHDPKTLYVFQNAVEYFAKNLDETYGVTQASQDRAAEVGAKDKWFSKVSTASTSKAALTAKAEKDKAKLDKMKSMQSGGVAALKAKMDAEKAKSVKEDFDADNFIEELTFAAETMTDEQFEEYFNSLSEEQIVVLHVIEQEQQEADEDSEDHSVEEGSNGMSKILRNSSLQPKQKAARLSYKAVNGTERALNNAMSGKKLCKEEVEDLVANIENFDTDEEANEYIGSLTENEIEALKEYFNKNVEDQTINAILENIENLSDEEFSSFLDLLDENQLNSLESLFDEKFPLKDIISEMTDEEYDLFVQDLNEEEIEELNSILEN